MNNLHVVLNSFLYPSRILKQVKTIAALNEIENIFVAALYEKNLECKDKITNKIFVNRFRLKTRSLDKNLFFQILKYIEFSYKIFIFYKKKKIKIINAHSLALLPICYLLKLIYGAKLVYDPHELETEKSNLRGLRKKLSKCVEYIFIKKADHIFVVGENIANWYMRNYKLIKPTVLFNVPYASNVNNNNYFRKKFNLNNDQIIFLYQGGLAYSRGVGLLLDAFKQRKDKKVVIIFMGYGELEEKILFSSRLYNNIFFHKAVSPSILLDYTSSANIGISLIQNTCLNHYYCMPNKLFEYIMAGLPVIVSDMMEMGMFVKKIELVVL